jgi:glycosyltransferase involved in cell wall biosynthesis
LLGFIRALRSALAAQEYDVIHAHTQHVAFLFILLNIFRAQKFMSRTVFTMHSSHPIYKPRNKLLLIPVFAFFRRVVCCNRSGRECLPRTLKWLAGDRLRSIQNCLDIDRLDRVVERCPKPIGRPFTLVSIGRLIRVKNPLTLLRAFLEAADGDSRLVFIGAGDYYDRLLAVRDASNLADKVEFTGLVPREEVYERLVAADLFISTSIGEGLPLAVLQAMACRRPVILSDIPPHREIASGAPFIPLVRPDDTSAFAREIRRFRRLSPRRRSQIGEQCRRLVEERFSLAIMRERYDSLYSEIANAHHS